MADSDTFAEAGHPDAAGWVLGVLDPEESGRFETHLESCPECQQAVAEFGSAAHMLTSALPGVQLAEGPEPPPDLQDRTLARVAEAASKARHNSRWRSRSTRILLLAASVLVAAGTAIGLLLSVGAPAGAYALSLHSWTGLSASASGTMRPADSGWSVQLTADHLPEPGPGRFYQCWWVGAGNGPGHPSRISAGTFTVGPSGTASVQMWTAANPDDFSEVEITLDSATQPGQPGRVVLSGTVDDDN
jgi:Anti-sigma-K factor rskA/Putative zinc-finger